MSAYRYARNKKLLTQSAIKDKEFREFFSSIKIKTVVEIGTHKGISAAHIASYAKKVFTFDISDYEEKYKVWEDLKVKDKIFFFHVKDRRGIRKILNEIKFDLAFIDGKHTYDAVSKDFELVKYCGKVLLHDVNKKKFVGVKKFSEEIGAKIQGNIAFWTK